MQIIVKQRHNETLRLLSCGTIASLGMKESREHFYSADERFLAAIGNLLLNFINLEAFYSTTIKSLETGKAQTEQEWREGMQKGAVAPEIEELIKANPLMQIQGFLDAMSQAMAKRSVRLAKETTHSAALVFAHTLLDEALSECCRISFLASPTDWYPFIEKRKVEIGALQTRDSKDVLREFAWEFVRQQKRESMVRRLQLLNQLCIPRLKCKEIPTAWLNQEALNEFDELRHRIIHGRYFSRPIRAIEDQLVFAKRAGLSMLQLVWQAYELLGREAIEPKSMFTTLRLCVVLRREFPEFIEFIEEQAELARKETP
jgi:hypothetical protein